jgi:hypothetical protein
MALTLSCAGAATLQSAYIVFLLSRSDIPTADLPPAFTTGLQGTGRITTLDTNIDEWGISSSQPNPTRGTWNASTTYTTGDTVASSLYSIKNAAGTVLAPLTYRSLQPGNVNHPPENFDGWWTCVTQAPHSLVNNNNFVACPFAYILSPLPDATSLAATSWQAGLGHSLSWNAPAGPPGDIVQLMDIYVQLNYLAGSAIAPVQSRPLNNAITTGTQGQILNGGINAQFQCWHTSGLSSTPELTLSNFDATKILNGAQPPGSFGASYLTVLTASGGTPPYAYAIVAGSLPPGVTLNPTTGVISGNPSGAGIFTFTAQVTDSTGATAQATCAGPIGCGGGGAGKGNRFY